MLIYKKKHLRALRSVASLMVQDYNGFRRHQYSSAAEHEHRSRFPGHW